MKKLIMLFALSIGSIHASGVQYGQGTTVPILHCKDRKTATGCYNKCADPTSKYYPNYGNNQYILNPVCTTPKGAPAGDYFTNCACTYFKESNPEKVTCKCLNTISDYTTGTQTLEKVGNTNTWKKLPGKAHTKDSFYTKEVNQKYIGETGNSWGNDNGELKPTKQKGK